MDHTALALEACALLRAAPHLRRAGHWDESAAALRRAAALIQRSVAVLDARLRHITARLATPGPLAPLRPVVLVVDDEHAILRLLTVVLGGAGFEVLTACCGPSAVTACHPGVDLVLLDGQLRGAWDGPRVLSELRQRNPYLRAAFMSGSGGPWVPGGHFDPRAPKLFLKPFGPLAGFVAEVRALLPPQFAARRVPVHPPAGGGV